MRVLLLTQYYPPEVGAAQTRLAAVTQRLSALGDDVEVVTALPNYPEGRIQSGYRRTVMRTATEHGVRIRRVWMYAAMGTGTKRLLSYASFAATSTIGLARSKRPDILVVESPPLFLAATAALYAAVRRVPMVLNVADLWPDAAVEVGAVGPGRVLDLAYWLERTLYRHAALVSTVTDGVRERLIDKGVPPEKIVMLPNGVDVEHFHPDAGDRTVLGELGIPDRGFVVYAGTVGVAHGIDPLIDAMASLADDPAAPLLVIVGSGSERPRVEQRVRDEGLKNIVIRDPISPDRLARLLPFADAAMVTLAEIPLNDAVRPAKMPPLMASGVPVVYAGRGEGADLLLAAGGGVVVANEAGAIAEAITRLAGDDARRTSLGASGRSFAVENWSWSAVMRPWHDALRRLAARCAERDASS